MCILPHQHKNVIPLSQLPGFRVQTNFPFCFVQLYRTERVLQNLTSKLMFNVLGINLHHLKVLFLLDICVCFLTWHMNSVMATKIFCEITPTFSFDHQNTPCSFLEPTLPMVGETHETHEFLSCPLSMPALRWAVFSQRCGEDSFHVGLCSFVESTQRNVSA